MTDEDLIIEIEKPHFVVKLRKTLLEVDLKEGVKKKLEAFVESSPKLRESLGLLFQTIVPIDVQLRDIASVSLDKKGRVKVSIPSRRDIVIPLDAAEAERLINRLNELIPQEKERWLKDKAEAEKVEREIDFKRMMAQKASQKLIAEK